MNKNPKVHQLVEGFVTSAYPDADLLNLMIAVDFAVQEGALNLDQVAPCHRAFLEAACEVATLWANDQMHEAAIDEFVERRLNNLRIVK